MAGLLALPAVAKEYTVFDVVGDSISAGVNPELAGHGWVQMLFGESAGSYPAKTNTIDTLWPGIAKHNSAVSGSTSADWAADWNGHLTAVKNRNPDLVVVLIGGNDFLGNIDDGFVSLSELDQYRTNLVSLVTNLQDNVPVPDIVLGTYYDLFDGHSAGLPPDYSTYTNVSPATVAGNQIVREVADAHGCHLIDGIHGAFLHHAYGEAGGDPLHADPDFVLTPMAAFDVHPVTEGHSKIHDLIFRRLDYLKRYNVPELWLEPFGLSNFEGDAALDPDADGSATWQEYIAGTDPTNAQSVFKATLHPLVPTLGNILMWDPMPGRAYGIHWSTNLAAGFQSLETNLSSNAYIDSNPASPVFYRMDVRMQ